MLANDPAENCLLSSQCQGRSLLFSLEGYRASACPEYTSLVLNLVLYQYVSVSTWPRRPRPVDRANSVFGERLSPQGGLFD